MSIEGINPDNELQQFDASRHSRGLRALTPEELADAIVRNSNRDDSHEPWSLVEIENPDIQKEKEPDDRTTSTI